MDPRPRGPVGGLEGPDFVVTLLRLFDASAPAPQMLKVRAYFGDGLGHLLLVPVRLDILTRRRIVGMTHGKIVRCGRAEDDSRKIGLLALVPGARDEPDDLCTHANASHAAIAIMPTSASDIRYAVIDFPSELSVRQIARSAIIWGANLIPCVWGRMRSRTLGPR